jgi:hypothetical protein
MWSLKYIILRGTGRGSRLHNPTCIASRITGRVPGINNALGSLLWGSLDSLNCSVFPGVSHKGKKGETSITVSHSRILPFLVVEWHREYGI